MVCVCVREIQCSVELPRATVNTRPRGTGLRGCRAGWWLLVTPQESLLVDDTSTHTQTLWVCAQLYLKVFWQNHYHIIVIIIINKSYLYFVRLWIWGVYLCIVVLLQWQTCIYLFTLTNSKCKHVLHMYMTQTGAIRLWVTDVKDSWSMNYTSYIEVYVEWLLCIIFPPLRIHKTNTPPLTLVILLPFTSPYKKIGSAQLCSDQQDAVFVAGRPLVDKLCNMNTHSMVEGCFSHFYFYECRYWYQPAAISVTV